MEKSIVRFEPYYNEWISMDETGTIYSVEFDKDFKQEDYPDISFVKPDTSLKDACSVPIVVQILMTRRCNYNCINCFIKSSQSRDELSTEEIFSLLKQCAEKGVLFVRFSGGEATLRSDFVEIVKYARSLGLRCALLSSCRNFTEEQLEILPELVYVQPHLDSVQENSFNKLTGGNNFKFFKQNLKKLKELGIRINPASTLQAENKDEIKSIIDFSIEYGIPVKINALYGSGRYCLDSWIDYYNNIVLPFSQEWEDLKAYASERGCEAHAFVDRKTWEDNIEDTMAVISPWGRSFIVLDCEGNIFPSSILLGEEHKIGSIREGDDLFDVWNNSPLLHKLRGLTKEAIGCGKCRLDCVYCNPFIGYSYFGEWGKVLPHNNCPFRKFEDETIKKD